MSAQALTLDLTDLRFTKGVDFDFAGSAVTSLAPGEFVLVVRNLAAFEARYGTGLPVAGEFPRQPVEWRRADQALLRGGKRDPRLHLRRPGPVADRGGRFGPGAGAGRSGDGAGSCRGGELAGGVGGRRHPGRAGESRAGKLRRVAGRAVLSGAAGRPPGVRTRGRSGRGRQTELAGVGPGDRPARGGRAGPGVCVGRRRRG